MANEETALPTDEEIAAAQIEASHIDQRLSALEAENARLSSTLTACEADRDANMSAAVEASRLVESLRAELQAAQDAAASEKARADRGDEILLAAAMAVPPALIEVRARLLREKQAAALAAVEAANAAVEAANAELEALGLRDTISHMTARTIRGIDVYDNNPTNPRLWVANGVSFGWVKISEGCDVQKRADAHVNALRSIAARAGGYHFGYMPRKDQKAAARTFCAALREVDATDIRPGVDLESFCSVSGELCVPPDEALDHCEALAGEIEQILAVEVIVYTGRHFWEALGARGFTSWLAKRDGWIADYNVACSAPWVPRHEPIACGPWVTPLVWQFSAKAPGGEDLDCNLTTPEGLQRLIWQHDPVCAPSTLDPMTIDLMSSARSTWEAERAARDASRDD